MRLETLVGQTLKSVPVQKRAVVFGGHTELLLREAVEKIENYGIKVVDSDRDGDRPVPAGVDYVFIIMDAIPKSADLKLRTAAKARGAIWVYLYTSWSKSVMSLQRAGIKPIDVEDDEPEVKTKLQVVETVVKAEPVAETPKVRTGEPTADDLKRMLIHPIAEYKGMSMKDIKAAYPRAYDRITGDASEVAEKLLRNGFFTSDSRETYIQICAYMRSIGYGGLSTAKFAELQIKVGPRKPSAAMVRAAERKRELTLQGSQVILRDIPSATAPAAPQPPVQPAVQAPPPPPTPKLPPSPDDDKKEIRDLADAYIRPIMERLGLHSVTFKADAIEITRTQSVQAEWE
jgi:hypothetical protein